MDGVIRAPERCLYLPQTPNNHSGFITAELIPPKSNFLSMCYIFLHLPLDLSLFFLYFLVCHPPDGQLLLHRQRCFNQHLSC